MKRSQTGEDRRPRSGKAASTIALAIEHEILEGHFEVGASLGTEAELCDRHGVSRWALREALAIAQHAGLVQVRRGRGGGAIVNATPEQSLAAAICSFLLYTQVDAEELINTRLMIDRVIFDAASACAAPQTVTNCAKLLVWDEQVYTAREYSQQVVDTISDLAGNSFVKVFALALSKLTTCRLSLSNTYAGSRIDATISRELALLREAQLRAVVGIDANLAMLTFARTAKAFRELLARAGSPRASARKRPTFAGAARIAEVLHPIGEVRAGGVVSVLMMLDIIDGRLAESDLLGVESELTERYGVARNVLREGIRILERDGLVHSRAGRLGGVRAGSPDVSSLVERAATIFGFLKVGPAELDPLAREVRMSAIDAVNKRLGRNNGALGPNRLNPERLRLTLSGHDLFLGLAELSEDKFLQLFEQICARVSGGPPPNAWAASGLVTELCGALWRGERERARVAVSLLHKAWMAGITNVNPVDNVAI